MSDPFADAPMPRWPLAAAGGLVVLALVATAAARWGAPSGVQPLASAAAPLEQRELRFEDRADGGITITEAPSGRALAVELGTNDGFVRATLRAVARERRQHGGDDGPPFRLSRTAAGRLVLEDPVTGRRVELDSFGPTNSAAFARLLQAPLAPAPTGRTAPARASAG